MPGAQAGQVGRVGLVGQVGQAGRGFSGEKIKKDNYFSSIRVIFAERSFSTRDFANHVKRVSTINYEATKHSGSTQHIGRCERADPVGGCVA